MSAAPACVGLFESIALNTQGFMMYRPNRIVNLGSQLNLCRALQTNSTLTALALIGQGVEFGFFSHLLEALLMNTSLTILDLQSNRLGDDSAILLSEFLRYNTVLKKLNLSRNGITSSGMDILSESLRVNSTLQTLIINHNDIEGPLMLLEEALKANRSLRTLDLSRNLIADDGITSLSRGLRENPTLLHLNLSKNPIGAVGAQSIAEVLTSPSSLQVLAISCEEDEGVHCIATALAANSSLTYLRLQPGIGGVSPTTAREFFNALTENGTLLSVEGWPECELEEKIEAFTERNFINLHLRSLSLLQLCWLAARHLPEHELTRILSQLISHLTSWFDGFDYELHSPSFGTDTA